MRLSCTKQKFIFRREKKGDRERERKRKRKEKKRCDCSDLNHVGAERNVSGGEHCLASRKTVFEDAQLVLHLALLDQIEHATKHRNND